MEVMVGSSFGIDVSSPPAYSRDNGVGGGEQDKARDGVASLRRFLKEDNETREVNGSGLGNGKSVDDSSDSCSIGAESEEEEEEEDDEVVSSDKALGSLASLEESLPIKKGLSSYYSGKSRSFADLSQLDSISSSAKDLWKPENPFNKKRRIQMANKWSSSSRRSSPCLYTSISVPLLPLNEEENIGDEVEEQKQQAHPWLKSESCFEISDLDEEEAK